MQRRAEGKPRSQRHGTQKGTRAAKTRCQPASLAAAHPSPPSRPRRRPAPRVLVPTAFLGAYGVSSSPRVPVSPCPRVQRLRRLLCRIAEFCSSISTLAPSWPRIVSGAAHATRQPPSVAHTLPRRICLGAFACRICLSHLPPSHYHSSLRRPVWLSAKAGAQASPGPGCHCLRSRKGWPALCHCVSWEFRVIVVLNTTRGPIAGQRGRGGEGLRRGWCRQGGNRTASGRA